MPDQNRPESGRNPLDLCRVCGHVVYDFERGGYEREDGQRGHRACDEQQECPESGLIEQADAAWEGMDEQARRALFVAMHTYMHAEHSDDLMDLEFRAVIR